MTFWNTSIFSFKKEPKHPTEFIQKFITDSKRSRVQLEIIRDEEILIQVDSLKQTPSWFKVFEIDPEKYKNGFAIFFILDEKNLEENPKYVQYQKSKLKLIEKKKNHNQKPVKTFVKFLQQTNDPIHLGKEMKNIIDAIFQSNEQDPQVLFNLRYLNVPG